MLGAKEANGLDGRMDGFEIRIAALDALGMLLTLSALAFAALRIA